MKTKFDLTKFEKLENTNNDTLKGGFSQVLSASGGTNYLTASNSGVCINNGNCVAGCGGEDEDEIIIIKK